MLIEEADPSGMDVACHFEAVNEGCIRVEWDRAFLTPSGQMFSVMKNHIDGKLCFTSKDAVSTEKDGVLTITLFNRSYDVFFSLWKWYFFLYAYFHNLYPKII